MVYGYTCNWNMGINIWEAFVYMRIQGTQSTL